MASRDIKALGYGFAVLSIVGLAFLAALYGGAHGL